jgi:hypothetical protein
MINDLELNIIIPAGITKSALAAVPNGYWRYGIEVFIKSSNWVRLEGLKYNYPCKPTWPGCSKSTNFLWPSLLTIDGTPNLGECMTTITLPFKVLAGGLEFCDSVTVIHDIDSDSMGIHSLDNDCSVLVQDGEGRVQPFWISAGSYRFIKNISRIGCVQGENDGEYFNCSGELSNMVDATSKDHGYDETKEVIQDFREGNTDGGGSGGSVDLDFSGISNFFKALSENIATVIMIIVIIAILAGGIILIIIYYVCKHKKEIAFVAGAAVGGPVGAQIASQAVGNKM